MLLTRLANEVGISETAHKRFKSYQCDRTQRVMVNLATSHEISFTCGVPQGSVLGPILFSLYTRQLGNLIEGHNVSRKLFADDTQLYKSFHPDGASMDLAVKDVEECCRNIKTWMTQNRLKLNDEKTEVILCGSETSRQKVSLDSIQVGSSQIEISTVVRDLGLLVDSNLTMVPHVSSVVKSCYFHLRTLGQLRPQLNRKTANAVAVSLIQSRLDFCNGCLLGLPQLQVQRLQKVQNTAARIVTKSRKSDHITPVLRDLHWLPVQKRLEYKALPLVFACMEGSAPEYLCDLIPRHIPSRGLRSAGRSLLQVPSRERHRRKTLGARSFESVAPALWNSLPQSLRECGSRDSFRRQLKTHLFRH